MNAGKYKGKQVGLFWQGTNLLVTVYHTGLFQAAGEATPDELYAKGQWSWTKVREIARRLTDARNPDQKRFGQVPVHKQHFDPWTQEVAAVTRVKNLKYVPDIMKVARAFPAVPPQDALQQLYNRHAFPLLHTCSGPGPKDVCETISREGTLLLNS